MDNPKKTDKKYAKVDKKLAAAKLKSPEAFAKVNKKFGYNIEGALKAGSVADSTGHWPSRNPVTGEIFKGRKHPTIDMTKKGEKEAGYKVYRKDGVLFSKPKSETILGKIKSKIKKP